MLIVFYHYDNYDSVAIGIASDEYKARALAYDYAERHDTDHDGWFDMVPCGVDELADGSPIELDVFV